MTMTPEGEIIQQVLMIADKEGNDVDFMLNSAQRSLDEKINAITERKWPVRLWVPKARQEGVSAYVLARFLIKGLAQRNRRMSIVAHEGNATQKLLKRVKYYISHMKGAQPTLKYNTLNYISFPKTDSAISIYTAGSPEAARSDTITDLHCSEAAFWPDPKKMTASLFQTVPKTGERIVESTGNGAETWYHRMCLRAAKMQRGSQLHFLPWHTFTEYTIPFLLEEHETYRGTLALLEEFDEPDLIKAYPELTPGQILWRRAMIEDMDMDIDLFKQEYPMSLSECFMMSQTSFFHKVIQIHSDQWTQHDKNTWALGGHPIRGYHYALGADVAAGVKKDNSVVQVFCYETGEQVLEWASNTIPPNDFAHVIEFIGMIYNWPMCVVESNNHGLTTLDNLVNNEEQIYPYDRLYWDNKAVTNITQSGFRTTSSTKPMFLGRLRASFAKGQLIVYSPDLHGECNTFTDELKAEEGCKDDRVMATLMAYVAIEEIPLLIAAEATKQIISKAPDPAVPFAYHTIFTQQRNQGHAIASQVSQLPY